MGRVAWGCVFHKVLEKIGEGVGLLIAAVLIGIIFFGIPMGALEGLRYLRSLDIPWVNGLVGAILLLGLAGILFSLVYKVVQFLRETIDGCRIE